MIASLTDDVVNGLGGLAVAVTVVIAVGITLIGTRSAVSRRRYEIAAGRGLTELASALKDVDSMIQRMHPLDDRLVGGIEREVIREIDGTRVIVTRTTGSYTRFVVRLAHAVAAAGRGGGLEVDRLVVRRLFPSMWNDEPRDRLVARLREMPVAEYLPMALDCLQHLDRATTYLDPVPSGAVDFLAERHWVRSRPVRKLDAAEVCEILEAHDESRELLGELSVRSDNAGGI